MSLWKIAWRSIQQRGLASALTTLSMALGVMLIVAILCIHGIVADSFRANTRLGYNIIVGATKGGKLQITLNSVFYLSSPVENIPYDYYLEFLPPEQRDREYQNSLQAEVNQTTWDTIELASAVGGIGQDLAGMALRQAAAACEPVGRTEGDYTACVQPLISQPVARWREGRKTRFGQLVETAIPLCLGDYLGNFRVVGTTPDFFDKLSYGQERDRYQFAEGRNMQVHSAEHSYFESVIGATVAREMQLKVGDTFSPAHGASADEGGSAHAQEFTVVGILRPSGTPNDRAAFVNMEGFFLMEDHAKPVAEKAISDDNLFGGGGTAVIDKRVPLPVEQREVTAVLVRTVSPAVALGLQTVIDEGDTAQVVLPVLEIYRLFEVFVKPISRLLVALTIMICVVSGVSILVSIYNSMSDRRHEIAVMRALGADRGKIVVIVLLESIMLSLGGGVIGWFGGHLINWLASGKIEEMTGVSIGFFSLAPPIDLVEFLGSSSNIGLPVSPELLIIPGLLLLAILVGFLPAVSAYRTDVAESLGK